MCWVKVTGCGSAPALPAARPMAARRRRIRESMEHASALAPPARTPPATAGRGSLAFEPEPALLALVDVLRPQLGVGLLTDPTGGGKVRAAPEARGGSGASSSRCHPDVDNTGDPGGTAS